MQTRFDYAAVAPGAYTAMEALERYLADCAIEPMLTHLIKLRASQLNGCAYCLDMHWKDLRAGGENEQRLYSLDAWRECPYYSARERAALAWTEAVTQVSDGTSNTLLVAECVNRPQYWVKGKRDMTGTPPSGNGGEMSGGPVFLPGAASRRQHEHRFFL